PHQKFSLCKEVSLATGVSERTISRVLAKFNKTGEFKLSKQDQWPPQEFSVDYANAICEIISSANQSGLQLTLLMIVLELAELNFFISKAQLS
ncbi:14684_t:CDS:1, partial [Dentiscutata heterogama]